MNHSAPSRVVDFAEASRIVRRHAALFAQCVLPQRQEVPLLSSLGRTLAQAIHADRDQPPFARSNRDGFACRAADLNTGEWLKIVGQVRAGETWAPAGAGSQSTPAAIAAGEAVEIMTGAPVPAGADCVIMLEHAELDDCRVRVLHVQAHAHSLSPGDNIVPMGAEARAGAEILASGARLSAAQIAAAAACGATGVSVFARPRVAIVATGDELVELGETPLPYQIRNSNSYSLAAQLIAAGAEPVRLSIARDDPTHLESLIRNGLDADLLLISGGVSMGKYDLVEQVLLAMGAKFFFTGVLIQPGKPIVFGKLASGQRLKYFFGLPGNPVSTMVTFSLFVAPLLAALGGERGPRFAQARLRSEFRGKTGLTRFLPAKLSADPEDIPFEPIVELIPWQGSGDVAGASQANCYLMVPSDKATLHSGETVTVLL